MDAAVQEAKDQAELNELLIWASTRGLLADAVELIARGAEPQVRDKQGFTPAHYAAAHGHLDLLQFLATKGADMEAEDPQARMPLHHAVLSGALRCCASSYSGQHGWMLQTARMTRLSTWLQGVAGCQGSSCC
ncbi:ankyrin repeat-containing domain protein [Scenedesmus sp. NREL 46B-D3]|nr:ankyrin repeat-containing domain protein [Scenedesmus sp. NREL 46B-D3]